MFIVYIIERGGERRGGEGGGERGVRAWCV